MANANKPKLIRFAMLGGFLGAGKTTALAELARRCIARNQRVAIITNDQADGLADTQSLAAGGFPVAEVAGACFCCRFDALQERIESLAASEKPDVIFAEPVGSCTDLVATVAQPLKQILGQRLLVAPFIVTVKPSLARVVLLGAPTGFSKNVLYIFHKQLEEADALYVSRADGLSMAQRDDLRDRLSKRCPAREIIFGSAVTGEGFADLLRVFESDLHAARRLLDIDYDVYAEGEAELGWLNMSARLDTSQPVDMDSTVCSLLRAIGDGASAQEGSVAHIKVAASSNQAYSVGSVVETKAEPVLAMRAHCLATSLRLTVNARVALDPSALQRVVEESMRAVAGAVGARFEVVEQRSLRPGRPVPIHRYSDAV